MKRWWSNGLGRICTYVFREIYANMQILHVFIAPECVYLYTYVCTLDVRVNTDTYFVI